LARASRCASRSCLGRGPSTKASIMSMTPLLRRSVSHSTPSSIPGTPSRVQSMVWPAPDIARDLERQFEKNEEPTYREVLVSKLTGHHQWLAILNIIGTLFFLADEVFQYIGLVTGIPEDPMTSVILETASCVIWMFCGVALVFDFDPDRFPWCGLGRRPPPVELESNPVAYVDVAVSRLSWKLERHVACLEAQMNELELALVSQAQCELLADSMPVVGHHHQLDDPVPAHCEMQQQVPELPAQVFFESCDASPEMTGRVSELEGLLAQLVGHLCGSAGLENRVKAQLIATTSNTLQLSPEAVADQWSSAMVGSSEYQQHDHVTLHGNTGDFSGNIGGPLYRMQQAKNLGDLSRDSRGSLYRMHQAKQESDLSRDIGGSLYRMHQAKQESDLSRDIGGSLYRIHQAKQNRKLSAFGFANRTVRRFQTGVALPSPKARLAAKVYRRQRGLMVDRKHGTPSAGSSVDSTSGVEVDAWGPSVEVDAWGPSVLGTSSMSGSMLETVDE